ncbi:amino acid adenylation domain-containing protein [Myxosarcina sp. GI1(2024)]
MENCSTVVELLQYRASSQSQKTAFTFLEDGETETETLTYGELDRRSRAIAVQLQGLNLRGERALLLYPSGLDYLAAFFGCLYAGVIAVPAYPPQNQRKTPRIQAIAADAAAKIVLTTNTLLFRMESLFSKTENKSNLQWLATDNLESGIEDTWQKLNLDKDTIAFLQYTSGSTGTPKGVMVSHGNLLHNAAMTYRWMKHSSESKFVSWLPIYHDMGLIGGILQPLYGGFPCYLMPPVSFLQRPYRWLQAISRYGGTTSGAPNFAYELCVQKITAEQKASLDLRSWQVAFNGAEPIRSNTLERFSSIFAECGFRADAFYPCYGMAETTLIVSGENTETRGLGDKETGGQGVLKDTPSDNKETGYKTKAVDKLALAENKIIQVSEEENSQVFVSCGKSIPEQEIAIVNPETLTRCEPGSVGEIWVRGNSIAKGYWNRPEETKATFQACLGGERKKSFLRTGDLGFLDEKDELFITGRLKDLIIIRGRNLYPQDIELTAETSHDALRMGSNAAFTVEKNNEEKLVIVQELEFRAKPNLEEVTTTIRQAVTEVHEIEVYGVVLIKPGRIPKTSSGKIQRRATQNKFLEGTLDIVASDILKSVGIAREVTRLQRSQLLALPPRESQTLLESYLTEQEARALEIAPEDIDPKEPLTTLGLDSLKVFELKNQIEVDLKVEVSVADFFEGMSTRSLVTKILAQITTGKPPSLSLTRTEQDASNHPLSFSQRGLWFIQHLAPNSYTYNIPVVIYLHGCVELAVLQACLNEIVRRHEILRTSFTMLDGQPVQVINQDVSVTLEVEDLSSLKTSDRTHAVQTLTTELAQQPFDLSSKALIRAKYARIGNKDHNLIIVLHHIVADGWSIGVLLEELIALYEKFAEGKLSPLSELPIQYKDFVSWQRKGFSSERLQGSLAYWKQKLQGELPVLNLPTDRPRPPVQTFKGDRAKLVLASTLKQKLEDLSRQQGVTLFMTLLTAFKVLLYRYTGQTDIIVGSPIANRSKAQIEQLIGFFVNVLVLRTDLSGDLSFLDLLERVKSTALEAYVHQDLPFEKLVEELKLNRDLSYNPLFQVMFVLQNVPKPNLSLSDLSVSYEEGYNNTSKFDLTLFMEDSESGLIATCEYNTDLFDADTITRMLGHFQTLLENIVSNPERDISKLPLLTSSEKRQLLVEWNNTKTDYPQDKCIHQLFEEQAEKKPNQTAIVFENQKLTYQELNNRANQLAHYLQQQGVRSDTVVGISMERSIEMVVGLLAILKAGGAYLPLDPAYPQVRLCFMMEDARVPVLLTQPHLRDELPPHQAKLIISIDTEDAIYANYSSQNPASDIKPENLAYVIYTSGSTGKPKGVMNTHRGICNRLQWMQDAYQLTPKDKVLQKTPYSFDVSVWEFFWTLITGASLVIARPGGHQDSGYLVDTIEKEEITTLHFVPSMLQIFLEEPELQRCSSLKRVICSGEALSFSLQEKFFARLDCELYNLYGPTEAVIDVTHWHCQPDSSLTTVPIGRPIANTQIHILDRDLQPVPIGVPGELYIGGVGLARGYLNRPELTKEKFIANPFDPGTRLYKTGDLARYHSNGAIEYLSRIDHQVKIRGFRIELGEIEAVLSQHPAVREAVVVVKKISQRQQLVAYIVGDCNSQWLKEEGKNYLRDLLPEYMLPSVFVTLDRLPLLPNGKVERRALPIPETASSFAVTHQAPSSEIERKIAAIWQEALHLEKVGIDENFFDLGGHSLLLLEVNQKLRKSLQQNLSVVEMFKYPTVKSLGQFITQNSPEKEAFESIRDRTEQRIKAINRQKLLARKR